MPVLDWGHNYGIPPRTEGPRLPWANAFGLEDVGGVWRSFDPNSVGGTEILDEVIGFLDDSIIVEKDDIHCSTTSNDCTALMPSSGDCFLHLLHHDIRYIIAGLLSVRDVMNLRLASRGFSNIFHQQSWWKTRFEENRERGWLFEAHNDDWLPGNLRTGDQRDWKRLFDLTRTSNLSGTLANRARIWSVIPNILDAASLTWGGGTYEPSETIPTYSEFQLKGSGCTRRVSGRILQDTSYNESGRGFEEGCQHLRSQTVALPSRLSRIVVYFVHVRPLAYVCGFMLVCNGNDGSLVKMVGYRSSNRQALDLEGTTSKLTGIRISVGIRGIHALQFIMTGVGLSKWFGDPHEQPRTNRLVDQRPLSHLIAGFDVSLFLGCSRYTIKIRL